MERFWSKVERTDGCWLWRGKRKRSGYGVFSFRGKRVRAHRMAWRLEHGSVPSDRLVCHRCDQPACVRPEHLFLGTSADNMRDMRSKGRAPKHSTPKLTQERAEELRRLRAEGLSWPMLSAEFGVGVSTARKIVAGLRYR
jgi:hypothetical protein